MINLCGSVIRSVGGPLLLGGSMLVVGSASAESFQSLLDGLAEEYQSGGESGEVRVHGWIEREGEGQTLVVSLEALGDVRLVADPGIIATPRAGEAVAWSTLEPLEHLVPGGDYFDVPQELRLPFELNAVSSDAQDGTVRIEADIEYAYCLVDYQCLFGDAVVSVPALPEEKRG